MNESKEAQTSVALLLDDNLLSCTRVCAQLERLGYRVQIAKALVPVPEAGSATESMPAVVVINLGSRFIAGIDLVTQSRSRYPEAMVVGFCGHREVDIWKAAREAGVHKMLTNDQAYTELAENL